MKAGGTETGAWMGWRSVVWKRVDQLGRKPSMACDKTIRKDLWEIKIDEVDELGGKGPINARWRHTQGFLDVFKRISL